MRVLLFNSNSIVSKLVTLSTKKTSDNLDIVCSVGEIHGKIYDLLIIDDSIFYEGLIEQIKKKTRYNKSLFISDNNSTVSSSFNVVLKKPFLPTELIKHFLNFKREILKDIECKLEDELNDNFLDKEILSNNYKNSVLDINEVQELQKLLKETDDNIKRKEIDNSNNDLDSLIQSAIEELENKELNNIVETDELLDSFSRGESNIEIEETNNAIALKNLLSALSDKKVIASLNGMKININITLGG